MAPSNSFNNRQPFKAPGPATSSSDKPKGKASLKRKAPSKSKVVDSSTSQSESEIDIPARQKKSTGGLVRRVPLNKTRDGEPAKGKAKAKAAAPTPLEVDSEPEERVEPEASLTDNLPAIPRELMSRLVHESFRHRDTRITHDALGAIDKYIELFVREALFRAHHAKKRHGGPSADNMLEV